MVKPRSGLGFFVSNILEIFALLCEFTCVNHDEVLSCTTERDEPKRNKMKTTTTTQTTFSSAFLSNIKNLIFITRIGGEGTWTGDWGILEDQEGKNFEDLEEAIAFIRSGENKWGIGLSTFEQAERGNAEWDNL